MRDPRYAIYLAPPPDSRLWHFGSRVLGYDAASGSEMFGFAPVGIEPAVWRSMTERPRTYGFHATLKAPFRLSQDATLAELEKELTQFSRLRPTFDLGPLAVKAIGSAGGRGFAALLPMRASPELTALEHDTVRAFDRFRAPLTEDERRLRKPDSLTDRQRDALDRFGYPHIGADYHFHMTLSAEVNEIAEIADKLADVMANELGTAHLKVDAMLLFWQDEPEQRFRVLRRFAMAAAV